MERMAGALVEASLAAVEEADKNPDRAIELSVQALFDTFESRGAARLAAWLELTGEWHRLTGVRGAISQVAKRQSQRMGISVAAAEDMALVSLALALGVGLFGSSLGQLMGKPKSLVRELAAHVLKERVAALKRLAAR
jgi:hypothetical protein